MKKIFTTTLLAFTLATSAHASLLNISQEGTLYHGITVPHTASLQQGDQAITLTTLSQGLRQKEKFWINWDVYVAEVMVSQLADFKATSTDDQNVIAKLTAMDTVALRLAFLRDVDSTEIKTAFVEALQKNGIDPSRKTMQDFLAAVNQGGAITTGAVITLVANPKLGTLSYEDPRGHVTTLRGTTDFAQAILSIWFGIPADDGLAALKKTLIEGMQ